MSTPIFGTCDICGQAKSLEKIGPAYVCAGCVQTDDVMEHDIAMGYEYAKSTALSDKKLAAEFEALCDAHTQAKSPEIEVKTLDEMMRFVLAHRYIIETALRAEDQKNVAGTMFSQMFGSDRSVSHEKEAGAE